MKPIAKVFAFGCSGIAALAVIVVFAFMVWLVSKPTSGVKLGNEMDQYALDYISKHNLLRPGEEILAYFDNTVTMDGTEAAILTLDRVMYHKNGKTWSIPIKDIVDIQYRTESWYGDIIEIWPDTGQVMKIEIPSHHRGETFKNVLMKTWEKSKNETSGE